MIEKYKINYPQLFLWSFLKKKKLSTELNLLYLASSTLGYHGWKKKNPLHLYIGNTYVNVTVEQWDCNLFPLHGCTAFANAYTTVIRASRS